jgi:hypothetical protein
MSAYIDDSFSWELEGNLLHYAPYNKLLPVKQVCLLELWDELSICHDKWKQEWGPQLTIIGMEVDANNMTITMPTNSHDELLTTIHTFAVLGTQHPLREFQKLGGWINWALNVFPLLGPGLCQLYTKMKGKHEVHAKIWISSKLTRKLLWLADYIANSNSIFILDSIDWPLAIANETLYCNASGVGMGYWSPKHNMGFHYKIPNRDQNNGSKGIFYFEAYTVVSAFYWVTHL